MLKMFQWLNVVILCLFGLSLGAELATQSWPGGRFVRIVGARQLAASGSINIDRFPKQKLDPIEITKIMEGPNKVVQGVFRVPPNETPGEPIPYSDDWIDNLSYTFKNLTTHSIEFMQIGFRFHYGDREDWHKFVVWNLNLGEVPPAAFATFLSRTVKKPWVGTGHPLEFPSGQEMTIRLAGGFADEIKAEIQRVTPPSSVVRCVVAVNLVLFDDPQIEWVNYGLSWLIADPTNPQGFRRMLDWPPLLEIRHATDDYFPNDR
jgi:hypothetical protein